ncbi:hypothetical protein RB653_003593 [Dictyostelium firmibasis]|uniref:Leucine-rich repeat-containing protein n=1 Tax=Dictyostelium firmibasis TaxID=79012 RepID=A0AAN7U513_9MYCE
MFSQFKQIIDSKIDNKVNTISKKIHNKLIVLNGAGGSPSKGNKDRNLKLSFSSTIFIPPPLPTIPSDPNLFKGVETEMSQYSENGFSFYYEDFDEEGFPAPSLIVQQKIPTIQPEPIEGMHPYGFNFEEYNARRATMNSNHVNTDCKPHFLRIQNENPIKNYAMTPTNQRLLTKGELMQCLQPTNITYICITDQSFTNKERRAFLKKLAQFSSVETLILKGCGIKSFANGSRFPSLRFVDLSQNSIKNSSGIKKLIKYSPWLEFLNLTGNGISACTELEWKQRCNRLCSALTQLENINSKPISIEDRIAAISLYGPTSRKQQLEKIRWELHLDSLADVRAMRPIHPGWQPQAILQIQLNNCQLRHFYIGSMINLNSLDLSRNFLTDISSSGIEKCTYLQYCNLSNNQLTRVDVTCQMFEFTPSIRCVVLSGNVGLSRDLYKKELIYRTRNGCGTNRSLGIQQVDNDPIGIDEKVSIIHEYELKTNGNNQINATKVSSELRWKLLIIERFGHKQLQSIPNFFDNIRHIAFPKVNIVMVDVFCFKNVEIIDFSGNDLFQFNGLRALYSLRILLLQDNPRLETKSVVEQLDQLERLESINLSVNGDQSHQRYPKHAQNAQYRAQVFGMVIPKNRSFILLDNTVISSLERVEAYRSAGYSNDLVERYRFFLALNINCTLPFGRNLYPDQVEIGKQYDPTQVTILRRLREWQLTSEFINFSYFTNIQEIDLTNNRLTDIINIGLQQLNNLSKLCLINNQINNPLPMIAQLLDSMKSLEIIAIRANPCMRNPNDRLTLIGLMSTMKSISQPMLKVIDTEISIYDKVEGWKLVGGPLKDAEMLKLNYVTKFKSIDLYDHNLLNLELCDCALEYLDITPFLNLRTLLLANNKFKLLSNIVGLTGTNGACCQQLFALDLRNNQLDSLSDVKTLISALPQLSVIGLSGNGFTRSSASPTFNYRPKFLSLITPLSQSHLYPLSMLDSSEITPDEINESHHIAGVDKKESLFNICLLRRSISPDFFNLTELDLSGCNITFCNFGLLQNLIILSLSDNNVSDSNLKDSGISSLNNLKALDLRNNRLKDLSTLCKIIDLLNIETLFIEENSCFEKDTPKDRIKFFKKLTNSRVLSTMKYLNGSEVTPNDTVKFNKKKK